MIVDTGCKYNIISSQLYNSQFKRYKLRGTKKRFVAYGQKDPLDCTGYFTATLKVGKNAITANVYVMEGHSESLLGRDSSFNLGIIKQVNKVGDEPNSPKGSANSELDSLTHEFDKIFHGIGKITNFEHKIAIDPNIKPVSQPLRRIPFSQVDAVNNELEKMLEDDIIEEVVMPFFSLLEFKSILVIFPVIFPLCFFIFRLALLAVTKLMPYHG